VSTIKQTKSERFALRLPERSLKRVERYAHEMGLSKSEAMRKLVDDRLDELKFRERNLASFERLIQISEYMFHSTIAHNEAQFSSEKRQEIFDETREALDQKHPLVE
jgi:metal-responsive CopG/Arc/MetJ family transcriptional regulator